MYIMYIYRDPTFNIFFYNTFDYNHSIYNDYLLYTVTASVHIIR